MSATAMVRATGKEYAAQGRGQGSGIRIGVGVRVHQGPRPDQIRDRAGPRGIRPEAYD